MAHSDHHLASRFTISGDEMAADDAKKLNRRKFLRTAATGAAATAALTACSQGGNGEANADGESPAAPVIAKRKRSLKMVTTWPKNLPGLGTGAERVARRITEMTDGELDIRVYAANELVPAFESFNAVSTGAADMYNGAEYYWQGSSKAFNFFTAVPFGLTATEINAWIYHGGGQALWDELSAKFNIKPFMSANTGVQMGGWFNKEINTVEDLQGLKMRIPGLGGEVLRRLGAEALALPGGEIYQALSSGRIDATEWVGPWNDLSLGFYRVAKIYYGPGFHEPGASLATGFNLDVWNSFTKTQQAIVEAACAAENDNTLAEFNANNAAALRTLVQEHNVDVRNMPDEVMAALGKVSGEVIREAVDGDELGTRILESFLEARVNGAEWAQISEEAYWKARRLDYPY